MSEVLIVSSSQQSPIFFWPFFGTVFGTDAKIAKNGSDARRIISQFDLSVVIINTPLSDEFGHELAITFSEESSSGVILIVKNEFSDEIAANVEDYGVLTVAKPINKVVFHQTLKLAFSIHARVMGFKKENIQLQSKIEEMRLVDRAKCALIQYLNMTEPEAHRHIEKQRWICVFQNGLLPRELSRQYEMP
jgi:response regulator NasT